jgi:hypothetical protein
LFVGVSSSLALCNSIEEKPSAKDETVLAADEEIKKERAKSLSVFGGLVSPKLRGAQQSFETGNILITTSILKGRFQFTTETLFSLVFGQLLKLWWK